MTDELNNDETNNDKTQTDLKKYVIETMMHLLCNSTNKIIIIK